MADAEALFAAYQPGLLRYLSRAVGHTEMARDLAQDLFVGVVASETLPGSDGERRAWIFRIARTWPSTTAAVRSRIHRAPLQLRERLRATLTEARTRPLRSHSTP